MIIKGNKKKVNISCNWS